MSLKATRVAGVVRKYAFAVKSVAAEKIRAWCLIKTGENKYRVLRGQLLKLK